MGLKFLACGDAEKAARWLLEACDEDPAHPRSVANRALATWLSGDSNGAYKFALENLSSDPSNEVLASYLPQIAVNVADVVDGLQGIPEALRGSESVAVGQAVFLRGRDMRPEWWNWVRAAADRHPDSAQLRQLVASSHVDEIARNAEVQRTQSPDSGQRETLISAAAVLDADWKSRQWLLKNSFEDAAHSLAHAMIAYRLLNDEVSAISLASRIADEALTDPSILFNAVLVAISFDQVELAKRLIDLLPGDPDLAFHAGVIKLREGEWGDAASLFAGARIPHTEQRIVETVVALTPIRDAVGLASGRSVASAQLEALISTTHDSPRGLILIARVAEDHGLKEVSQSAFEAAIEALPADCSLATRIMVAAYAERAGSPRTVIDLLDGYLPSSGFVHEHERLAIAHANEFPRRKRNLAYFDGLPPALKQLRSIALAHSSVLLDVGDITQRREAVETLKGLHRDNPNEALIILRLLAALRIIGDEGEVKAVSRRFNIRHVTGAPEHVIALAQIAMQETGSSDAYSVAYDLVRLHSDNSDVVLGYLGLGLMLQGPTPVLEQSTVGLGAWVQIQSSNGTHQEFVIDSGGDFFGVSVLPPEAGIVTRVHGLKCGETFQLEKLGADPETWTVVGIQSKYLHLHRRILEQFETRFPDVPGVARFNVGDENVDSVLQIVRRSAELNAANAQKYIENSIPLAIIARGLGGDAVSFASYIRALGGRIAACVGSPEERNWGIRLSKQYRDRGGVLDPYTAWVAAEIGALPALKSWFGSLHTPASTIEMVDRMVEREREGRGREQMTIGWNNGHYYREIITDEVRERRMDYILAVRESISENCIIANVIADDELSEAAELAYKIGGRRFLDAALAANEAKALLLSDDMHYRGLAFEAVGCEGVWLQAVLHAAFDAKRLSTAEYAKAVVGLARHAHSHLSLTAPLLYYVARYDGEDFADLRALTQFLGGSNAHTPSHQAVLREFLWMLWPPWTLSLFRTQAATGLTLDAFLTGREDWCSFIDKVIPVIGSDTRLNEYIDSWFRGHFLASDLISPPTPPQSRAIRRRRVRATRGRS